MSSFFAKAWQKLGYGFVAHSPYSALGPATSVNSIWSFPYLLFASKANNMSVIDVSVVTRIRMRIVNLTKFDGKPLLLGLYAHDYPLPWPPLPNRNHQLLRVAVLHFPVKLSWHRKNGALSRYQGYLWSNQRMVSQIYLELCQLALVPSDGINRSKPLAYEDRSCFYVGSLKPLSRRNFSRFSHLAEPVSGGIVLSCLPNRRGTANVYVAFGRGAIGCLHPG